MSAVLIAVLALLALCLLGGAILGFAAVRFRVEGDPIAEQINALLPQTQCGQCGYPGCAQAAAAVAAGNAPVTLCPPGGRAVAEKLAEILGATFNPGNVPDRAPLLARVRTDYCIGCSRCIKACPTDAILGATKQLHVVLGEACIGCGACAEACPTGGIDLEGIPVTLRNWRWHKPGLGKA